VLIVARNYIIKPKNMYMTLYIVIIRSAYYRSANFIKGSDKKKFMR